jgi:hypothetical protein
MSTLSASSSYSEIRAAFDDNASYEEDGSVAKAKAFITACRMLLRRTPKRAAVGGGGHELELDPAIIKEMMADAQEWIAANDVIAGGRTTYADFTNFRD